MKKILIIDNYDSFTFNLVQLFEQGGANVTIRKPNEVNDAKIKLYDGIVLSPGPGIPTEDEGMKPIIDAGVNLIPILGICFGYLALAVYFGASLKKINPVVHGQKKIIVKTEHDDIIFRGLPESIEIGLYHSWVLDPCNLPDLLVPTSLSKEGHIMSMKHLTLNIRGTQFHPESYMTKNGLVMAQNWLSSL